MTQGEILDVATVCHSFPALGKPQIRRDNFLNAIQTMLEGDSEAVVIEGQDGMGKTTLLAQFAMRHPDHAICLFVRSTSRWAYDPGMLRYDLCNQLQWLLHGDELPATQQPDDGFLRTSLTDLQRRARRKRETYYFLLDGLDEIPAHDKHVTGVILDLLPFGLPGFRFLLSGRMSELSAVMPAGLSVGSFLLSGFVLDETIRYMEGLGVERASVKEIHQLCRGIPGYLASVARIIQQTDVDVESLMEEMPDRLPGLFDIEWRSVNRDDERQMRVLATLAHDPKRHRVDELGRVFGLDAEEVEELLRPLGFVTTNRDTGEVGFVSDAFRQFARRELEGLRDEVTNLLINDLMQEPEADESLSYLPVYLASAGRFEDLVNYLSPDNFYRMLASSQSLSPVLQKARLGADTALELRRDGDLMRFSLQRAAMEEVAGAEVWRSEIEARMALDDYDSAVALAQSAVLREDRLHLLAVIAKTKREQGLSVEPELNVQIRRLYEQIDATALGARATDIASDLVYSNLDLALDLVEKATSTAADDNALDWALAKLSIAALARVGEEPPASESVENIRSRIRDPKIRRFFSAASLLMGDYSAEQVIARAERLEGAAERLLVLRQWAVQNWDRENAARVVDFALKTAIGTTGYRPNARALRELATPLPSVRDEDTARRLVGAFDSQKAAIEPVGPTEDYVRLALLLAETEAAYDFDAGRNRLVDLYFYISGLDDLAVKTGCLARMMASLGRIDPDSKLEAKEGMHSLTAEDLHSNVGDLLAGTARHYEAVEGIIEALAVPKPAVALEVATALNTQDRRDLALLKLVESALEAPLGEVDLPFLETVMGMFVDLDLRDEALVAVLDRLSRDSEQLGADLTQALTFIRRANEIRQAGARSRACCRSYELLVRAGGDDYAELASKVRSQLDSAWRSIAPGWHRADVGFRVARSLATLSLEEGRVQMEVVDTYRDTIELQSQRVAWTYLACLRLALRAFNGLLAADLAGEDDEERLARFIERIPDSGNRAVMWAELALRYHLNDRPAECKRIVLRHVNPLLQDMSPDASYQAQAIARAAPAVYCAHEITAHELIGQLPPNDMDKAYAEICDFILRKKPTSDPYEVVSRQPFVNATFEDMLDICDLLNRMDQDGIIYHVMEAIADTLVCGSPKRFSRQQRLSIADRLEELAKSKFPNPRYIAHEGYAIVARAQIARLRRSEPTAWTRLIEMARDIPNVADRAYVLCVIGVGMSERRATMGKQTLEEAVALVEQVPTVLDRAERYERFAAMVLDLDRSLAKECLQRAMDTAVGEVTPQVDRVRRRIVDTAYRLDPDLAASLASLADDDPARGARLGDLKERVEALNLRGRMGQELASGVGPEVSASDCGLAAWLRLAALNSGRVPTVHAERVREILRIAADARLGDSYGLIAWAIENGVVRFAGTDQARTYLRPVFDATVLSLELVHRMATHSSVQVRRAARHPLGISRADGVLIGPGERESAIQYLTEWLGRALGDYLKVCDPYFGPVDLELLQIVLSVDPACKVHILTSKRHQDNEHVSPPWGESYRTHWRIRVSEEDPPNTEIVIAGTESGGQLPIHDRWWLTRGGGIRMGTSFNALGAERTSEISILSEEQAEMCEREVDLYLQRSKREHEGERLLYDLITL